MGIHYSVLVQGTLGYKLSERDVAQNKSSLLKIILKCTQTLQSFTNKTKLKLFTKVNKNGLQNGLGYDFLNITI